MDIYNSIKKHGIVEYSNLKFKSLLLKKSKISRIYQIADLVQLLLKNKVHILNGNKNLAH